MEVISKIQREFINAKSVEDFYEALYKFTININSVQQDKKYKSIQCRQARQMKVIKHHPKKLYVTIIQLDTTNIQLLILYNNIPPAPLKKTSNLSDI